LTRTDESGFVPLDMLHVEIVGHTLSACKRNWGKYDRNTNFTYDRIIQKYRKSRRLNQAGNQQKQAVVTQRATCPHWYLAWHTL
jgi:hypothetical protein